MERNDTLPLWIGAIVLVVLVGGYFAFANTGASQSGQGKVYVTISDAAVDIQNVSEVAMTVDKVELHSAAQGWVTVSSVPHTFNLLTLKASGKVELAGTADIAAGTYDQVRATISSVDVHTKTAGTKAAVVVSHTLTIPASVVVTANESSSANLDVQTSSSLYTATKGEYVFAPVIAFESRHGATVATASDNSVTVSGGTVDTVATMGVDLSGNANVGLQLAPNTQIQVVGGTASIVTGSSTSSGANAAGLIQISGSATVTGNGSTNTNSSGGSTSTTSGTQGAASSSSKTQASSTGTINLGY